MHLKDTDFTVETFATFISGFKAKDYDDEIENFEEGTFYFEDKWISPDYTLVENEVNDQGKYQSLQSVYQYVDKNGDSIYVSYTCTRSGSHFSEYYYQDYELSIVSPHRKEIIEYY